MAKRTQEPSDGSRRTRLRKLRRSSDVFRVVLTGAFAISLAPSNAPRQQSVKPRRIYKARTSKTVLSRRSQVRHHCRRPRHLASVFQSRLGLELVKRLQIGARRVESEDAASRNYLRLDDVLNFGSVISKASSAISPARCAGRQITPSPSPTYDFAAVMFGSSLQPTRPVDVDRVDLMVRFVIADGRW